MRAKYIVILALAVILAAGFLYWQTKHGRVDKSSALKGVVVPVSLKSGLTDDKPVKKTVVRKAYKRPRVAIVVDDFGYSRNNLDLLFSLKQPVTLSILPGQRYTREVADLARARGFEVILHLPLEPEGDGVSEEADTIKTSMSEKEILLCLKKEIELVPGIIGVSNHMGSKATANKTVMTTIIRYLNTRGLYYFDSLTSSRSVCLDVAKSLGVKFAKRDIFLDNSSDTMAIEKQLTNLKIMAFKRGRAIAICHDRKNTIAILAKELPKMAREGIDFVRLSEMVK